MIFTPSILTKICPSLKGQQADDIFILLKTVCPLYGIDSADVFHEFIANVLEESAEFSKMEENLNYSTDALIKLFSRQRISIPDAIRYGRNPVKKADKQNIANCIYGGSWGKVNLGNTLLNDGYSFRGSGFIQITGRENVTLFTNYYNPKFNTSWFPEQMAELMRIKPSIAMHSACWFFAVAKNLIQLSIDDNFKEVVKRINGGFNGLSDRAAYYERAKRFIV